MHTSTCALICAFAALPAVFAACGENDVAKPNDRGVVAIAMTDNDFDPNKIEVDAGETVTFRFSNRGDVRHEAFIGTPAEQDAHAAEMQAMADDHHGEASTDEDGEQSVTVAPDETEDLEFTFGDEGTVLIGCHESGHYESGMRAEVSVQ